MKKTIGAIGLTALTGAGALISTHNAESKGAGQEKPHSSATAAVEKVPEKSAEAKATEAPHDFSKSYEHAEVKIQNQPFELYRGAEGTAEATEREKAETAVDINSTKFVAAAELTSGIKVNVWSSGDSPQSVRADFRAMSVVIDEVAKNIGDLKQNYIPAADAQRIEQAVKDGEYHDVVLTVIVSSDQHCVASDDEGNPFGYFTDEQGCSVLGVHLSTADQPRPRGKYNPTILLARQEVVESNTNADRLSGDDVYSTLFAHEICHFLLSHHRSKYNAGEKNAAAEHSQVVDPVQDRIAKSVINQKKYLTPFYLG